MSHPQLVQAVQALETAVDRYAEETVAAAGAEADHKRERAKRMLRARSEGIRSISEAEAVAEADDFVAELYMRRLTTSAVADASKQRIVALRERIGALRSYLADQRAADSLHARTAT